jgi:BioD-like phosphotransacetylase family protein
MSSERIKRVFVAATNQDQGKTTVSLGLLTALREMRGPVGFIKPVGQRCVKVEGLTVDEDAALMRAIFHWADLADMSPVTVDRRFTREYIRQPHQADVFKRITDSFARMSAGMRTVVIEGTGHAGVGSCFDASNADVARLLDAKVIIVSGGGIGKPIDDVMLNKTLFNARGVEVLGVILNKVLPDKLAEIREIVSAGLSRLGIDLLGCIPHEPLLSNPTVFQVREGLGGEMLNGEEGVHNIIESVIVGAMTAQRALEYITPRCLLITPGDRDDLILAAIASFTGADDGADTLAGIVLTGGIAPTENILKAVRRTRIPVLLTQGDSYTVASAVNELKVKTQPQDLRKIQAIPRIVRDHVDVARIAERM